MIMETAVEKSGNRCITDWSNNGGEEKMEIDGEKENGEDNSQSQH